MIFTVPLQAGTTLANVRYKWLAAGVLGAALDAGITQPDEDFPMFRISAAPPDDAEELIVFDNTDAENWNVGAYLTALVAAEILKVPRAGEAHDYENTATNETARVSIEEV